MKNFRILIIFFAFFFLANNVIFSQSYLGKMSFVNRDCPKFDFTEIDYYEKKEVSLEDFRGKWLVLDFWGQYCASCVNSMTKMSDLQKQFAGKVQIIMVGIYGSNKSSTIESTRKLYEKVRKESNLHLVVAYDTLLAKTLKVGTMPDIIVIDPSGVIRVRANKINSSSLLSILRGESKRVQKELFPYGEARKIATQSYDRGKPFHIDDKGDVFSSYIYRSLIVPADSISTPVATIIENGRVELLKASLLNLYEWAYFGTSYLNENRLNETLYTNPILEIADSSAFYVSDRIERLYCYSLVYPKRNSYSDSTMYKINDPRIRENIQSDLQNAFPFVTSLEERMKPYFKLVAKPGALDLLRTKGGTPTSLSPNGKYHGRLYKNVSIRAIISFFTVDSYRFDVRKPIIDLTGITENIDIEITGFTFEEQVESLRRYGLDLILDEKPTTCLVIRDKCE